MNNKNFSSQKLSFVFTIAFLLFSLTFPTFIRAQSRQVPDFSGTGRPNEQTDGGTRGNCQRGGNENKPIVALVPKTMALTVSEYPTFWVYIPDDPSNLKYGELVVQDEEAERPIYRIRYELENTPGIISVRSPSNPNYALELGKLYRWYFKVVCKGGNNLAVGGLVQRVTLDPSQQNYTGYLNNRIWHDALTELGDRRRNSPQDRQLKNDWETLLEAKGVGLERLVGESLVPCCNVEN